MKLKGLELKNYRNCKELNLDFDSAKILIIGKNAQGKTNILESIYFLSNLKSQRTSNNLELINFEESEVTINANIIKNNTNISITPIIKKLKTDITILNGVFAL